MRAATIAIIALSLSVAAPAWAEQSNEQAQEAAYLQHLVEGHRLYANHEAAAAQRAYEAALAVRAGDALVVYLIGATQRAQGNLDEALESFRRAAELARSDDALHLRALMSVAFVQEARRDLTAARSAWRSYIEFAESHSEAPSYVANARARLDAITAVEELDAAYGPVRQRIQERAAQDAEGN